MKISKPSTKQIIPGGRAPLLAAGLVLALVSAACSLFGSQATPTKTVGASPTPNHDFFPTHGPLAIQPATLPAAQQGATYEVEIQIIQYETPVGSIEIKDGQLPAGLTFEFLEGKNAARISGTPTESGSFTFTLFAWCYGTMVGGQTLEKEYQLVVDK